MESDLRGFNDVLSYQRPTKKKSVIVDGKIDKRATAYANDIPEPSHRRLRRLTPSVASVSVKDDDKVESSNLVAAHDKLPLAKHNASKELEALLDIPPDDPRLTSEGDLIQPIVWRKNVTVEYWHDMLNRKEDRPWYWPYLHCMALVDGNIVIYELITHAHDLFFRELSFRLTGAQFHEPPEMKSDFLHFSLPWYTPPNLPKRFGDDGLLPESCNDAAKSYPSVIFEVGVFEPLHSLQQKAIEWLSYSHPPAAPGVVSIQFVQLVILAKFNRTSEADVDRYIGGRPAIRAAIYLWMRYDPYLHSALHAVIAENTPNLPDGGVPNINQAVCIASFECGDYVANAQQNLPADHISQEVLIPRYALYARTPKYEAAYQAAVAADPVPSPLFPAGSPYAGDMALDVGSYVRRGFFRKLFVNRSTMSRT